MPPSDIPLPPGENVSNDIPAPPGEESHSSAAPPAGLDLMRRQVKIDLPKPIPSSSDLIIKELSDIPKSLLSIGDMIGSIPASVVGVASDAGFRVRGMLKGDSHAWVSREGNIAYQTAMETYGNPFTKLLHLAGVGKDGDASPSTVDNLMAKAAKLIDKGGEWVDEHTKGAINKDDVTSITNAAMALAGGKGMEVGLRKLASKFTDGTIGGVKLGPEVEAKAAQTKAQNSDDPSAASKMAEGNANIAQEAVVAKTKLQDPKDLTFDPIKGELSEKIPEPGKELPKQTAMDSALDKAANGRLFDMTAEERIALKGLKDAPLGQPIIDEQGKILDSKAFAETPHGKQLSILEERSSSRKRALDVRTPKEVAADEAWKNSKDSVEAEPKYYGEEYEDVVSKDSGRRGSVSFKGGRERGSIDPKLLSRMAAVGLGAWAGYHFSDDKDFESAVLGGVAGFVGAKYAGAAVENLRKMAAPDTRLKINDLADAHEKYTKMAGVDVWSLQKQIEDLVPEKGDREAITHAVESRNVGSLTPKQQAAAKIATDYFDGVGRVASLEGILKSAREDYVTHIWDWNKNKGMFQKWMDGRNGGPGMGSSNKFAQERSLPTIQDGKNAGLTPLTEDISHIMGIYGNSMSRSIANKVFTRALMNEKTPSSSSVGPMKPMSLVMKADDAPHSYVPINNPAMIGLKVHPDIAPSLKMLYDTNSPGAAMKIMQGLSDSSKRVAVSYSLFHAKALADAMIAGSKNPLTALAKIPGIVRGTNQYLQELRKGSASPLVERALEGGLNFSLEGEGAGVEDAGVGFYGAMEGLQGALDKAIPGAGLPIKGLAELNKKIDTVMWARLHAGMKLNMFAEKYQTLLDNAAKKPGTFLDPDQAARIAASYTNDLFGGLNWRRIAEDAKTRFGREVGQALLNPGARRVTGLLAFAPDWTVSTTRAMVQAIGKPDFISPTTLAGLHQQYLIRAAVYYLVVGDAINYSMSGHHIWNNKDWSVLDLDEKGEKHMQWSKHTMEPVHWMMKPGQQAVNKLGMIPREVLDQTLGVEYLSANGRMPRMENRVAHLAKNFAPIAVQQAGKGDTVSAVAGFAGVPVYGKTGEERKADREAAKEKKKKRESE